MLAERPDLLADTAQRALRYLAGLDSRRVAPAPADVAGLDRLDFPLPAAGLDRRGGAGAARRGRLAATVATAGPRYFGFVIGGALPARARPRPG